MSNTLPAHSALLSRDLMKGPKAMENAVKTRSSDRLPESSALFRGGRNTPGLVLLRISLIQHEIINKKKDDAARDG
jgi:hypothetical protein